MHRRKPASNLRRSDILRLERLEERVNPVTYSPSQIRHAYGFDQVAAVNGTPLTGLNTTIAIVDAYYDSHALSDLQAFDSNFQIADPPTFTQVNQSGGSPSSLGTNSGWATETALDIEYAHAIAPQAKILLVEANDSGTGNLSTAVNYARTVSGVVAISMSWGGGESQSETGSTNNMFTTPTGHIGVSGQAGGVSFVASAGDTGSEVIWPAVSPNVLSVGGTTLNLNQTTGNYSSETAWASGGGGPSLFFPKPSYQSVYSGNMRGTPDISYDANPSTGVLIYDNGLGGVGGTSAGAPQWAGLIALADQGRSLEGLGSLDGISQLLPAIYAMPSSDFNDVTSGSNGHPATTGYDLATGLGSPKAQLVIAALVAYGAGTAPSITTQPVNTTVNAGMSATFIAAATGSPAPTVQWQISTDGGATFTNISGATTASYTTTATVAANNGYEFRAVFTNTAGTATTNAATITVDYAPSVTTQPTAQSVPVGQTATFTAAATGNPAPTVQWQVSTDGGTTFTNISGATSTTYSFVTSAGDNGKLFRAVFTNSLGSTNSNAAPLATSVPTTVANVQVGDGSAQRSEVQSITVTFSGPVTFTFGSPVIAFQLLHVQTGNMVSLAAAVSTNGLGQTVVTLTFSGSETDALSGQNGGQLSLADGRYSLTIVSAFIAGGNGQPLDGDGDGVPGGNYVSPTDTLGGGPGQLHLYRLFGDATGDGIVDQQDLGQFRTSLNSAVDNPLYLSYLDADNSGVVDQVDLGQFRTRLNSNVF